MSKTIPKRIIQTDRTFGSSPLSKAVAANIQLLNPDFEYIFFDDNDVTRFVEQNYPEYLQTFESFPVRIQRFDFFRYLAVYKLGGFYFDIDVLLASSLNDLLDTGCVFSFERLASTDFLRRRGMYWEVGNYAFGATAGHPFLHSVIKNCVRAQLDIAWRDAPLSALPRALRNDRYVIYTTGPGLVTRTLIDYTSEACPVKVLVPDNICDQKNWNHFGHVGIHLMQSSWRRQSGFFGRQWLNLLRRRNVDRAVSLTRRHCGGRASQGIPDRVSVTLLLSSPTQTK